MNLDYDSKELRITVDSETFRLHPLWIRERSIEESAVDQSSMQRLYDPEKISTNLEIKDVKEVDESKILIKFSDNHEANYCLNNLIKEIELPREWQPQLKSYCDYKGIEFMSTPFDEEAVEELVGIGVSRLKISGLIFGEIWIEFDGDDFNIDADLSLKKGIYMKEAFDEMMLSCLYKNGMLHIDDISMTRKGSMGLQATGIIPITKSKIRQPNISLKSNFSNLSLQFVHRFIPKFFNISGNGTGNLNFKGTLDSTLFRYDIIIVNASFDLVNFGNFNSKGEYDGKIFNVKHSMNSKNSYGGTSERNTKNI